MNARLRHAGRVARREGATLIELVVALTISAIVIALVFTAWTFLSRHTVNERRKSIFHADVRRVSDMLAIQIKQSPRIVDWHQYGIRLVSPRSGDTVSYEFYGEQLFRNDTALTLVARTARLTDVSFESEPGPGGAAAPLTLLHVSVEMEDDFGNHAITVVDAAARVPPEGRRDDYNEWNF